MHLIQILLPLADNEGREFPEETLRGIHAELAARFGGLTAYSRSPARGIWKSGPDEQKDDIVIVEVMAQALDEKWWTDLRSHLEKLLGQEEIVIRATEIRKL
ncbi:MAG TPA: hypothetical protein VGB91_02090 [Rhizomicrobium sp.]